MGFGSKCSILNGQVIYIEKSKLNIADMWLIPLDRVTYVHVRMYFCCLELHDFHLGFPSKQIPLLIELTILFTPWNTKLPWTGPDQTKTEVGKLLLIIFLSQVMEYNSRLVQQIQGILPGYHQTFLSKDFKQKKMHQRSVCKVFPWWAWSQLF